MKLLGGKVVLITGGARGQGRAHAVASARAGADVVLVDVTSDVARSVQYPLATVDDMERTAAMVRDLGQRVLTFDADVRDETALGAVVDGVVGEFGGIDALIANAGIWAGAPVWEIDADDWDEILAINLTGVWKSAKALIPQMISRGSGSIVVISSSNGLEPGANYAGYASAKHGVIGLAKNLALELAPHGVRCNVVCPGAVDTPMMNQPVAIERLLGHPDATPEQIAMIGSSYHALRTEGFQDPACIADAAVFLNSDMARAVTGAVLPVDSGHSILTGVNFTAAM